VPPELIAGRYRVERAAGHGGMGTVWLCHDDVLGREVAVKQVGVLPGQSVPDLARALREARSSAALHHPHVVAVFDAIEADDHIWLVMEYVPGSTLAEIIRREGRLDPLRAAHIGAQVADGLAAAHARGTIHRDVKPGNVLVTDGDVAKVSDFGIARTHGDATLTRSGMLIGTPQYFSPEIARGADPSPSSDVWALGATLYHAVEGVPLVADRGNPIATLAAVAEVVPPPAEHAEFLAGAIARMLDRDPAARWSMADAAHALQRLDHQHRAATLGWPAGAPNYPDEPDDRYDADDPDDRYDRVAGPTAATGPGGQDAGPAATGSASASVADDARSGWSTHSRRGPWLVALLVLLLLGVIGLAVFFGRDQQPTAASPATTSTSGTGSTRHTTRHPARSPSATGTGGGSAGSAAPAPTPTTTAPATTPTTTPSASTSASASSSNPAPSAGSPERAVTEYYGLLPDDTADAWAMLGPGAREQAGGYGRYQGFWRTIDSLAVGSASLEGDVVTVDLTYNGSDSETRRLEVQQSDGRWVIAQDLGPG